MDEGAARGDSPARDGLAGVRRLSFRFLVVAGVGLVVGMLLTAPIVGWPNAFPGLLMNAPERLREIVGLSLLGVGVFVCLRLCRRWIRS